MSREDSQCWPTRSPVERRGKASGKPLPVRAAQRLVTPELIALLVFLPACRTEPEARQPEAPEVRIPHCDLPVEIDGKLDDACYLDEAMVARFVVAGAPGEAAPGTRAWLSWSDEGLFFAFDCEDEHVVSRPPSAGEKDVDPQDRVEVFLWSGRAEDGYHCLELSPGGAAHDYVARFYRRFDDSWSPAGLRWSAAPTAKGYSVEGELPRTAVEDMGFRLRAGERWRLGLFRADFEGSAAGAEPRWITWVDHGGAPDFHVAGSFGYFVLEERHER
jgi:hypothetical protein